MSESPAHPDAPRAGGETPPIDLEATLAAIDVGILHARRSGFRDTETRLTALRAALPSLLERQRDGEREPEPCGKCGQPQSHPHHDTDRWPGRLTTGHPHHAFVPRSQLTLQDLSGYRPAPRGSEP